MADWYIVQCIHNRSCSVSDVVRECWTGLNHIKALKGQKQGEDGILKRKDLVKSTNMFNRERTENDMLGFSIVAF